MGRSSSQERMEKKDRKDKKDKKDKKQKKQKHHKKDKLRDDERNYSRHSRSSSKDRKKEHKKDKYNDRLREQQRSKERKQIKERQIFVSKTANSKSRQRSRQVNRKPKPQQPQEQDALVKQRRLALARMLTLDDQDVDLQRQKPQQKQKQPIIQKPKPEQIPVKPIIVEDSKTEVAVSKKKSRWQKTSQDQPSKFERVDSRPVIQEPVVPKLIQIVQKPDLQPYQQQHSDKEEKIYQNDMEEQSIPVNPPMTNQQDDLDAYMRQIEGAAVPQMQLTQVGRESFITYQDIVTKVHQPVQKMQIEQQQESESFKNQFMKAFEQIVQIDKDQQTQVKIESDANVDIIEGQENELSESGEEDNDDNFLDKQKRLAERKQYNQIDHSKINYEQVRFNLYRQAEQIRDLTKEEVDRYRKDAGEIKVRGRDIPNPVFNWYQCGLSDKVLEVIQQRKYKKPFPIQAQSFPLMMSGRDVIGIAETGSGKTMAYMIPTIRHVEEQRKVVEGEGPIALIMTPTRQLARQVYAEFKTFCKPIGIRVLSVYGGLGMQIQLSDLKKGAEIIICTPGRLIDVLTLNGGKVTNLRRVTMIVIDEADRMFDLGFQPQITKILNNIRPTRQTVMFSATFPKNVQSLAKKILKKPAEIIVGSRGQACVNIDQIIEVRQETSKLWRLLQILGQWNNKGSILIFVDKKTQVDFLFKQLLKYGYHSLPLHSGMDPTDREFNVHDFRKSIKNILVATSICSRGLDIKSIVLVVNFKCPNHIEDYIHRIGRTGRAGNKGTAITFITPEQDMYSSDMIKALEMADVQPSEELRKLEADFLVKVKKGEARKNKNGNRKGIGFKFDEDEEDNNQFYKDIVKKQFRSEGLQAFNDSDDEDLQKQKKREEDKRGRNDKNKAVEALKDPELKQKLLIETAKALNEAISSGIPMTTDKIIKLAVQKMKEQATKHVIVRTAQEGQQRVLQIIDEFQKTNPDGPIFSYDYQINDFPLNARSRVTNPKFLSQIKEQTACTVSSRGQYFEAGKKLPHGARKLYLHIQGQNKTYVSHAYKQIKRMLQQESTQNYQGQLALKYGM